MSTSLSYFSKGIAKAFERRAKQQAKQNVQTVEKVDSDVTMTGAKTTTTKTLSNEQYQSTIIQTMIARIKQNKETK